MASRPVNLPPGFVLEQPSQPVNLPPGFVLEQPSQAPSAPEPEKPWYEKTWEAVKSGATTDKIPWSPLYLGAEMGKRFGNKAQAIADEQVKQGNPIRAGIMESVADANKTVGELLGATNSPVGMALSASPAGGPLVGRLGATAGTAMAVSQMGGQKPGETTPDMVRRNLYGASAVVGATPMVKEFGSRAFRNQPIKNLQPGDVVVNSMEEAREFYRNQSHPSVKGKTPLSAPRSELFREAQKQGVNLDLADATGNAVARGVKEVAKRSLGGGGTFERNTNRNLTALDKWGNSLLNEVNPNGMNREQFGNVAKSKLLQHQQTLNNEAGAIFDDLTKRQGAIQPDAQSIEALAQKILSENREYYAKHPDLVPKRAWSILKNLSRTPETEAVTPVARPDGFETFHPDSGLRSTKTATPNTWADLHKLRSDLMAEYRSPELVGSQAEGWLKQMVEAIDNTMTSEASHLSPADQAKFRQANDLYRKMKETYDNPQHPFYSVVRAGEGTQAGNTLFGLKPGYVNQLREAMGEDFGLYQRDFVHRILDPRGQGFELQTLNGRVGRMPAEQLQAVLDPKQLKKLRMYSDVSHVVTKNVNPSGTSDVLVKAGELTNLVQHPMAGAAELTGTFAASKAMTNPRLTNFFVREKGGASPRTPQEPTPTPGGGKPGPKLIPKSEALKDLHATYGVTESHVQDIVQRAGLKYNGIMDTSISHNGLQVFVTDPKTGSTHTIRVDAILNPEELTRAIERKRYEFSHPQVQPGLPFAMSR